MGSPCRVDFVSDLNRIDDSLRTFPGGWRLTFAMGSPISGRVALFCALDRNKGFFLSSILRCFAMGPPCGSCVFFSHSIVTKALPPPSWCLVGVFAMGSPCRVDSVSGLDRIDDSLRTFPGGWRLAFAMGSPVSGRVALFCALDRNKGFFRSSILRCLAMGPPCGSCVFFSHSIVMKPTLDSWSVFLQDGGPLSGLDLLI